MAELEKARSVLRCCLSQAGCPKHDIELGVPVSEFAGRDDIKLGETASGDAVVYMHEGPYTDLKPVYQKLFDWIGENGCTPKGLYYEYYFNSPGDVPEKNLVTRIVIPVEK